MASSTNKSGNKTKPTPSSSSPNSQDEPPPPSELVNIGITLLGTLVAARILSAVSKLATALAAPLAGLYLMSTCPRDDTFDGKRELKRVLRGENLPENHPNKPKGFLEKALAKVSASIEAEAAAFAGCKVDILDIMGAV
ncbi:predicted protein, partial [Thalassiosira pseudonana CCMP1335]